MACKKNREEKEEPEESERKNEGGRMRRRRNVQRLKTANERLPWRSSGKESIFQCRGHGLIPSQRTKIPHAAGQLNPHATTTELACLSERACMLQTTEPMHSGTHVPQLQSTCTLKPTHHS